MAGKQFCNPPRVLHLATGDHLTGAKLADLLAECGAQLDLRVGSIDLKLGPWLLCVLATAIPTGFNGILSTIGTIGAISSAYWDSTDWLQLAAFIGLTVAFGSALAIVVRRRSRFLRKTTAAQWRRAWILVVIMAGVQALTIWGLYVLM
ncbi:MAG: hypothetical protein IIB99_12950 [Planctomycetes bacterium]|nr:hypothetical protein [Planctomycetota bacterium]